MRLKFPLFNAHIDTVVEDNFKKSKRRKLRSPTVIQTSSPEPTITVVEGEAQPEEESFNQETTNNTEENNDPKPVLMVEVDNVQHEKFKKTEEVKVNKLMNSLHKM